jgi:hypothetical protein
MLKVIAKLVRRTRRKKTHPLDVNLGDVEIPDTQIKYDFELLDRYQSFSAEVLRLSLIGLGAYAFLLKDAGNTYFIAIRNAPLLKWLSVFGLVFFALACAASLVQRYYSSDVMAYHMRYLRLKKRPNLGPVPTGLKNETKLEKESRDLGLQLCEVAIGGSALFLGLGTVLTAIALLMALFFLPQNS